VIPSLIPRALPYRARGVRAFVGLTSSAADKRARAHTHTHTQCATSARLTTGGLSGAVGIMSGVSVGLSGQGSARKVHAAMRLSQRLARAGPHARWETRLRAAAERRVVAEIEGDELLGFGDRVRAKELRDEASEVGLPRSWGPRAVGARRSVRRGAGVGLEVSSTSRGRFKREAQGGMENRAPAARREASRAARRPVRPASAPG
jgi:hypothetical protein